MTDDPFEGLAFDGDPLLPDPGREDRVVQRVRLRRRRRQALVGSGTAAVVAGVVLAGSLLGGGSRAAVLVPATDTPTPAVASPTEGPTQAPTEAPTEAPTQTPTSTPEPQPGQRPPMGAVASSASWVSPDEGFAVMASACEDGLDCTLSLAATADSGRTWRAHGTLPVDVRREGDEILFLDSLRGWDYVPFATGTQASPRVSRLFATEDGARTWREIPLPADFLRMALTSDALLVQLSDPSPEGTLSGVYRTPFEGRELVRVLETSHSPMDMSVWRDEAWLVPDYDASAGRALTGVRHSADGGRTWSEVKDPCPSGTENTHVAARGDVLLISCAGNRSMGLRPLLRSTDGGATFTAVDAAPCDPHDAPLIVSATSLLCYQREGNEFLTTDSGAHWKQVIPPPVYDPHAGAPASVESADVLHYFHGNVCERSEDGGRTWSSYRMD